MPAKRASSKTPAKRAKRSASAVSKRNRERGQDFEREVAHAIANAVGVTAKRRLGQERESGHDIDAGVPWTVECKRVAKLGRLTPWMRQAAEAALATGHPPVVIARADKGEAYAVLRLSDFLAVVRGALMEELL